MFGDDGRTGGCVRIFFCNTTSSAYPRIQLTRRRQLPALADWTFNVSVADVDESTRANESPADYVLMLAESKARAVSAHPDQLILATDATVVDGNAILGKPKDNAEAFEMLTCLRGRTHGHIGNAEFLKDESIARTKQSNSSVDSMCAYSDEEINAYIQTGDPLDKTGAYAIQHPRFKPVHTWMDVIPA